MADAPPPLHITLAASSMSSLVSRVACHPLDTIKTCMQGDIERATYTDFMGTAKTLLEKEGYGRFFNGWAFRTTRMICAIWLIGQCKNLFGPFLFPHSVKQEKK